MKLTIHERAILHAAVLFTISEIGGCYQRIIEGEENMDERLKHINSVDGPVIASLARRDFFKSLLLELIDNRVPVTEITETLYDRVRKYLESELVNPVANIPVPGKN